MKRTGKWIASLVSKVAVVLLVILLLPFAKELFTGLLPDIHGEISTQSRILEQKLKSSKRLEVTTVEEEGMLESKTSVILLGTVGKTYIRYRYSASIGVDLSLVELSAEEDRIVFTIPPWEVLQDGIEALDVRRLDFFSHAIDKSTEQLLAEQKALCREQFSVGGEHDEALWADTTRAFEETICEWLETYGDRHYRFEFLRGTESMQHTEKER